MADQERQIRFLYPPFFLLASLLWGLYLDPNRCLSDILPTTSFPAEASKILGLIAGGGIFIIAAGFLSLTGVHCTRRDRLVCTGHSRFMCTSRSRLMCTTHNRLRCTT